MAHVLCKLERTLKVIPKFNAVTDAMDLSLTFLYPWGFASTLPRKFKFIHFTKMSVGANNQLVKHSIKILIKIWHSV